MYVCMSVCPRGYLRIHTRDFYHFLCMLPMSMARSSFDMFTVGRIAYRQKWVFFPIENASSAGKGGGSAQRGRSMLFTIALLSMFTGAAGGVRG